VLGLGAGFPLLRAVASAGQAGHGEATSATRQWGLVIDIRKCMRQEVRDACTDACRREHNIPTIPDPEEQVMWIWSENYENAFPDRVHDYMTPRLRGKPVLVLCNHCSSPPCVKVCPTQATWKRESDGIVMMDFHRCIGCRFCMAACPFGARSFNFRDPRPFINPAELNKQFPTRTKGVVEKCNFCAERLAVGQLPACVEASNGKLVFGDLYDPESKVRELIRTNYTIRRKQALGTEPAVYYIV